MGKKRIVLYGVVIFLLVVVALIFYYPFPKLESQTISQDTLDRSTMTTLTFGDIMVYVDVARTLEEKAKGLSHREFLREDEGMLFVYTEPSYYGFWMPDMFFALDIIWFNEHLVVVDITENVTPESYPEKFRPKVPAQYVLEVNSGYTKKYGITVGAKGLVSTPN
jgi:uncharacterized membrane protein (UPF0127 family)